MTRLASYMVRSNGPAGVRCITSAWPCKRKRDADCSHRNPPDDRARHDRRRPAAEVGGRRPRYGRRWCGRSPLKPRHRERVDPHHGVPGVGIFPHQSAAFNSGGRRSQATIDHPELRLDSGSSARRATAARPRCAPWRRPTGRAASGRRRRASGSEVAVTTTHSRAGFPALRFSAASQCRCLLLPGSAGVSPASLARSFGKERAGGTPRAPRGKSCERRDLPLVESIASE